MRIINTYNNVDGLVFVSTMSLFSTEARQRAVNRFPEGTLDLWNDDDFTVDCTTVSLLEQIAKGSFGTGVFVAS